MARYGHYHALVPLAALVGLVVVLGTDVRAAAKAAGEDADEGDKPAAEVQVAQASTKKKADPVAAQRAVDNAVKLLEAGKAEQATQVLSGVVAGGNLPPTVMAKALLHRGIAYRHQKKPAQAIADLTSALWLKGGLTEAERAEGLRQRTAAYQEAGLSQGGEVQTASAPKETRTREPAAQSSPWGDATTSAPAAGPSASLNQDQGSSSPASSGNNWFSNLFSGGAAFGGGSETSSAPPPDAAAILNAGSTTAIRSRPARTAVAPQTSGWSQRTEVQGERAARVETAAISRASEPVKAEHARSVVESAPAARAKGSIRIQLAAVRTETEAKALAAKVKREHGAALAQREPQIDQTVMGNMGSFYRVLVGPFASAQETQGVCARLKGSGLDCLITAQ